MKNKIYTYFFYEFARYFTVVVFALTSVIWAIQAVNFLDLVIDDGHAFGIYITYTFLILPKLITKLIPLSFLFSIILTIHKLEKDNELIALWTSGLNKIHIVNLILKISISIMVLQLFMSTVVNPETLNYSRSVIKNSQLQFVPSLLKERQFNDTVKGLTIFVNKKNTDGTYENIFIRDEGKVLTQISNDGSSTIFARSGYVSDNEKKLILLDGNIQRKEQNQSLNIIKFKKTEMDLSGLSTKTISEVKIQETSTFKLLKCIITKDLLFHNCTEDKFKDISIEINKRFGMPFFIPLIGLICCFLLTSRQESKISPFHKHILGGLGFIILVISEITVRYSGLSLNHTAVYYLLPMTLLPFIYIFLIRTFKYENLN
tara:strand:- start:4 stop:1125 length:1122 start_codon:yes stop_codon:yes gene_type:complete